MAAADVVEVVADELLQDDLVEESGACSSLQLQAQ